ncbi:AvrD family protein [Kitasatospora sp. NPDC006697]|uniref:AvrD family protein n=1 Tax=Kitasatospora sp. NPDC006697 TaxID=3364020 RepID=UPI003697F2E6
MTGTATELRFDSIDDYLGPGEGRFFGGGYRRAEYAFDGVTVDPQAGSLASLSIGYPADWSRKSAGVDLRPHLSTVDMLVLGLQLSEAHLVQARGLAGRARRAAWLRKVTLRAGNVPQEDLTGLPATAKPLEVREADGRQVSVYDAAVGAMTARYEIDHAPLGAAAAGPARFATLDEVLGPAGTRYYGDGFKRQRHEIRDVRVDLAQLRSGATVRIATTDGGAPPADGIDGAHQPLLSVIDCFVVNLQLAQIMMYEMDAVRRQDSNTLWMVRTVLDAAEPERPWTGRDLATTAEIAEKTLVPLRGKVWRQVRIRAACGGVTLATTFAHELPPEAAARATA